MKLGIEPRRSSSVQLDCRLGRAERRPREDRQTQIDGRGIQGVDGVIEFHAEAVLRIELARSADQVLREIGVQPPIAALVGIGQCRTRHRLREAHVIELGCLSTQAGLDVAQTLPIGQLGEGHHAKLLGTRERTHPTIGIVPRGHAMVGFPR